MRPARLRHRFTRPYTPRTNGKAERFIQTALREWAYARHWTNSEERDLHLLPWLEHYNFTRPHDSLGYAPPISRERLPDTVQLTLIGQQTDRPPFSNIPNGSTATSVGGVQAVVNLAGGDGQRRDEGNGWIGNFTIGDELFWTNNNGPMTFNFTTPVSGVGAQISSDAFGAFVAQICDQRMNCFTEAGNNQPTEDGSAIFIGLANDPGITSVTFSLLSCVFNCNDFAINQMDITTGGGTTPEPSSLLLMGSGLLAVAGFARRRFLR